MVTSFFLAPGNLCGFIYIFLSLSEKMVSPPEVTSYICRLLLLVGREIAGGAENVNT